MAVMLTTTFAFAQNVTISGTVVDAENDEPLIGASVQPVGSSVGVATDIDGHFTLSIPASVKQLTVSYIGMETKTVAVSNNMVIRLQKSSQNLEEVVVTGYGSGKRLGKVVGSVAVVGEAVLENTPATTFVDALQGQVPGLAIYSNSGDPSSNRNVVYMRGINSLTADNDPLYILDGAPITSTVFTTLNPADIKNITVLKDAASVAIYGARAANGVIVITSKKGNLGEKSKVTIRANVGWSQLSGNRVDMMNAEEYIKFRDIIGMPVDANIGEGDINPRILVSQYGVNTDWTKEVFNSAAPTWSLEGVLSGGSEASTYYLSLSHYAQEGIIDQSGMNRESLRFSLDSKINDWFRLGFQSNLGYTNYETNAESEGLYNGDGLYVTNPMILARKALPYDLPYYYSIDENGNLIKGDRAAYLHYSRQTTPYWNNQNRKTTRNRLTINANIFETITPIEGLTLRAQQSVDAYDNRVNSRYYPYESRLTPMGDLLGSIDPETEKWEGFINSGSVGQSFTRYYSFTYTNTAEYQFKIAEKNSFSVLLGEETIISKSHQFSGSDGSHLDRRLMLLGQGLQNTFDVSESIGKTVFNSIFANLSYDFDSRYFIDLSYRRDGSSKFAPNHRWANFLAVGLMWNIKGESFMKDLTWLTDLRLRYSYGSTGNSGIDNYAFYSLAGSGSEYENQASITISSSNPGNPDLTWETVYAHDLGLNFSLFNRVNGKIDFYTKETKDMLMAIPYSITTGVGSALGNIASMRNRGFEVEVDGTIYQSRDWFVGARVGFAFNENRITKLFDGRDYLDLPDYGMRYEVGHDANEFWSVPYLGVDPQDGKQVWQDKNGNPTKVYNPDDRVLIGKSSMAPWTGGFGFNARWKGLSLAANFNWAAQKYMMNNDFYFTRNALQAPSFNQNREMLTIWQKPGDITNIPKYGEVLQYAGDDTSYLENASFVRLKNLTLQYDLPSNIVNRWGLDALSVHFTGRNLLTFTGFTGYDPEPQSNYVQFQYPNTRQYEFGIEVTF